MRTLEDLFSTPEQAEHKRLIEQLEEQANVKDQWFDFMAECGVDLEVAYTSWENQSRYGVN